MQTVALGSTGIQVSRLGIGLSEIGSTPMELSAVESLLNGGLDIGINFLDTAACYGNSEELVGKDGRPPAQRVRPCFQVRARCRRLPG